MSCSPSLDSQSRIDLAEKISSDLNIAFCALGDMFFFFFSTSESKNKPITSTSSHTNIRNSVSENAIRTVRMSKHSSCQSMESDLCVDGMRVSKRRGLGFPGSPCVSTSYRGRHGSKEVRMPHRRTPPPRSRIVTITSMIGQGDLLVASFLTVAIKRNHNGCRRLRWGPKAPSNSIKRARRQ